MLGKHSLCIVVNYSLIDWAVLSTDNQVNERISSMTTNKAKGGPASSDSSCL